MILNNAKNTLETAHTKVLIADNHLLIREGLKSVLLGDNSFKIIAEAGNRTELTEALRLHKPDIVIMDYDLPGFFSVEDLQVVYKLSPNSRILIITTNQNKNDILKVLEYGVSNYILKLCDKQELLSAIQATLRKEKFVCNKVVDAILEKHFVAQEPCEGACLSQREIEIVQLIAQGYTNLRIAETLFLSIHTISTHRKNILKKLGLKKSSELVMYAIRTGIVNTSNKH